MPTDPGFASERQAAPNLTIFRKPAHGAAAGYFDGVGCVAPLRRSNGNGVRKGGDLDPGGRRKKPRIRGALAVADGEESHEVGVNDDGVATCATPRDSSHNDEFQKCGGAGN